MPYALNENRRHVRYDFPATIEYVLEPGTGGDAAEVHKGVTVNISAGGLAAYVFDPHQVGQKIVIKTSLPVDCQTATVCWISKKDIRFYLAGLKFL